VARSIHVDTSHTEVAWLHPRQVVYEYLHIPPTGELP
jgi:hypothetical protein